MNSISALVLPTLVGFAVFPRPATAAVGAPDRNVVVILMDDTGTDFLSLFDELNPYSGDPPGNGPGTSNLYIQAPRLQALADEGVTFLNAYAMPLCSPSRACVMTGSYPVRTGVGSIFQPENLGNLHEFGDPGFELPTLAELVRSAGYEDTIVGKWHLGMPRTDMDKEGSDLYRGWYSLPERGKWSEWRCVFNGVNTQPMPPGADPRCGYTNFYFCRNYTEQSDVVANGHVTEYVTAVQFDEALAWCNARTGPFFCLITPNASHSPWEVIPPADLTHTPEYLGHPKNAFTRFCATFEALDTKIGHFVDGLSAEIRANTLFIVLGDNGSERICLENARSEEPVGGGVGETGSGIDLGATYDSLIDAPEDRFKRSVYEKGIRVPMIVSGAGVVNPGRTTKALVDMTDVFPTVAEIVGADPGVVNGISFLPVLEDQPGHARDWTYAELFTPMGSTAPGALYNLRRIGCSQIFPGADKGRFKVVRDQENENDRFYRLEDENGAFVDPWELAPLPLPQTEDDPYWEEYVAVVARIQAIAASGASMGGTPCGSVVIYCTATPTSPGDPVLPSTSGTRSISVEDFVVRAAGVPQGYSSTLLYSRSQAQSPFGNATLCLGGPVYRVTTAPIVQNGERLFAFDYDQRPSPAAQITAGSVWNFQLCYSDPTPGGTGRSFSDASSVTFCP